MWSHCVVTSLFANNFTEAVQRRPFTRRDSTKGMCLEKFSAAEFFWQVKLLEEFLGFELLWMETFIMIKIPQDYSFSGENFMRERIFDLFQKFAKGTVFPPDLN